MYNLITIGDAVLDTHLQIDDASVECKLDGRECKLCLDYAGKVPITDSFQSLGGNSANVAIGAVKLGLNAMILTHLGADANGRIIKKELKDNGVDTSLVKTDKNTATRYSVVLNFQGERTILSYHQRREYVWPKKVPPTEWIYYTSLSEGFEPLQQNLFAYLAKYPSTKLAMNPGSFQIKNSLSLIREAAKKTDLLILNLEEAEKLANVTLQEAKSEAGLIHTLADMGAKEIAITDAGRGAWAGNAEEVWQMDPYPVEVLAKTGAGDAFSSGYLTARALNHDMKHALVWGIANASSVITGHGPIKKLLDKKGMEKMSAKYSNIIPKIV